MRKRYISDDQLNRILKLKQSGASWLNIQNQTGIPRRSAKNAFEEWERNQSFEELKAARIGIATEEFRKHVDQLPDIGKMLIIGLSVPQNPEEIIKSNEFIDLIWEQKYTEEKGYQQHNIKTEREKRQFIRECNMLIKSLQDHTREKVDWKILDLWKGNWDRCIVSLSTFNKKQDKLANEIVLKDKSKIIDTINKKRDIDTAANEIAQAILNIIWGNIVDGTLNTREPLFNITYELFDSNIHIPLERELFVELKELLQVVAVEFCTNNKIVQRLVDNVININENIASLEKMLNPLLIKPLILRTRCELCPA